MTDPSTPHIIAIVAICLTCVFQFIGVGGNGWATGKDDDGEEIKFGLWTVCYDYKKFSNGTEDCEKIEDVLDIGYVIRVIRAMEIIALIFFVSAAICVFVSTSNMDTKIPRRLAIPLCFVAALFGIVGKSFFDGAIEYRHSVGFAYVCSVLALVAGFFTGFMSICVCAENE